MTKQGAAEALHEERTKKAEALGVVNMGKLRVVPTMKEPTLEQMMEWESKRGGCYSITGDWVEPDGHGPDGAPSWMLYLGYI